MSLKLCDHDHISVATSVAPRIQLSHMILLVATTEAVDFVQVPGIANIISSHPEVAFISCLHASLQEASFPCYPVRCPSYDHVWQAKERCTRIRNRRLGNLLDQPWVRHLQTVAIGTSTMRACPCFTYCLLWKSLLPCWSHADAHDLTAVQG